MTNEVKEQQTVNDESVLEIIIQTIASVCPGLALPQKPMQNQHDTVIPAIQHTVPSPASGTTAPAPSHSKEPREKGVRCCGQGCGNCLGRRLRAGKLFRQFRKPEYQVEVFPASAGWTRALKPLMLLLTFWTLTGLPRIDSSLTVRVSDSAG